jgi:hypothetical protein
MKNQQLDLFVAVPTIVSDDDHRDIIVIEQKFKEDVDDGVIVID